MYAKGTGHVTNVNGTTTIAEATAPGDIRVNAVSSWVYSIDGGINREENECALQFLIDGLHSASSNKTYSKLSREAIKEIMTLAPQ